MNTSIKNREQLLKADKKENVQSNFLERREKLSARFTKKRLFSLFKKAYESKDSRPRDFKFRAYIVNVLKGEKINYFEDSTYKALKSLFKKFRDILEEKGDNIFEVLGGPSDISDVSTINDTTPVKYTQLSLFNELDMRDNEENLKKQETIKEEIQLSSENVFGVQELFTKKEVNNDKIDLDALYAPDPDEPWWNK